MKAAPMLRSVLPKRAEDDAAIDEHVTIETETPPPDPLADLVSLKKALDEARDVQSQAHARLNAHREGLAAAHSIVAAEITANRALADVEGRFLVDPTSVTVNEIDAARAAAQAAQAEGVKVRPRIAALERAVELAVAEESSKGAIASEAQRAFDAATAEWLRSQFRATFDRFDAAHAEMTASIAQWNAIDQLLERFVPANGVFLRGSDFNNPDGFLVADLPSGPDTRPYRQASRAFPGHHAGRLPVFVTPAAIRQAQAAIRARLAALEIYI